MTDPVRAGPVRSDDRVRSFATKAAARSRIRVNTLSPGHIDTPIMESLQQGEALERMKEEFARNVPLGRMGDPDEIAKALRHQPCETLLTD